MLLIGSSTWIHFLAFENSNKKQFEKEQFNSNEMISKDPEVTFTLDYFVENKGQMDPEILYYTELDGVIMTFGPSDVNIQNENDFINLSFSNSNKVNPGSKNKLSSYSNFFTSQLQVTEVSHFTEIWYKELYDGIDLRYFWIDGYLKYEFHVNPWSDYSQIQMIYSNYDTIEVQSDQITIIKSDISFVDKDLQVYYADNYEKIDSSFVIAEGDSDQISLLSYNLIGYDLSRDIVIDPYLISYSSYIGGNGFDDPFDIYVDDDGYIYMAGFVGSVISNANTNILGIVKPNAGTDIALVKFEPGGRGLNWITIIGGGSFGQFAYGLSVDSNGNIYLTGSTSSDNFPVTSDAYQNTSKGGISLGSQEAFVLKLAKNGSKLLYSTFLGGSQNDVGFGISVDNSQNAYVVGFTRSSDFPVTNNSTYSGDGTYNYGDIFISKISANGSDLLLSMLIGGTEDDFGVDIALDSENNFIFVGGTFSNEFPTSSNAYDQEYNGHNDRERNWQSNPIFVGGDIIVSKYSPTGELMFSTFLGGDGFDWGISLVVDSDDNIYVTGTTESSNLPVTPGVIQTTYGGHTGSSYNDNKYRGGDIFVSKFDPSGSRLDFSTYFGGIRSETGFDIKLDNDGFIYLTGVTSSEESFPITSDANYDKYLGGLSDMYLSIISQNATQLVYSSYYGGNQDDWSNGIFVTDDKNVYIAGITNSLDLFITNNAFQDTFGGNFDMFLMILSGGNPSTTSNSNNSDSPLILWNSSFIVIALILKYRPRRKTIMFSTF